MEFLFIAALLLLVVWIVLTRRKLRELNGNVDTALHQIGLQLYSRHRALTALQELERSYGMCVHTGLAAPSIGCRSTPVQVLEQEQHQSEALQQLVHTAHMHPALSTDPAYLRCMEAALCYSRMLYTSSLIYNDSVSRFNLAVQKLPARLIAGQLGFAPREYLELAPDAPVCAAVQQAQTFAPEHFSNDHYPAARGMSG